MVGEALRSALQGLWTPVCPAGQSLLPGTSVWSRWGAGQEGPASLSRFTEEVTLGRGGKIAASQEGP